MTVQRCQPDIVERLRGYRIWSARLSHYAPVPVCQEGADAIATLQARVAEQSSTIDLLESNARVQAKLLADTGRKAEDLESQLAKSCDDTRFEDSDAGCARAFKAEARVDELTKALKSARVRIELLGVASPNPRHLEANEKTFLPAIDEALGISLERSGGAT